MMNKTAPGFYDQIGGEAGVKRLADAYLEELQNSPNARDLCALHTKDFEHYRERIYEYFSGFLGGPALYTQKHGLTMMRERHRHIPITAQMRDQWYECMRIALEKTVEDEVLRQKLDAAFWDMAESFRNC